MSRESLKKTSLLDAENEIKYCKKELKKKQSEAKMKALKERLDKAEKLKKKLS